MSKKKTMTALAWLVLSAAAALAATTPADEAADPTRVVREGIAIDVDLEPLSADGELREGEDVRVTLTVTDTNTGAPITSLYPAGWMHRVPADANDDNAACKKKVEGFLSGSLLSVPDLDLNIYYVLAMNNDGTISVVDPLFGFGGSKLLDMVFLESPGEDWVLTANDERLFVSQPLSGKVAVVDTATFDVVAQVEVGPEPTRLVLTSDERFLWVTFEGEKYGQPSGVSVIDTASLEEVARIATGHGGHDLVLDDRERHVFVTNTADGTLSVVDAYERKVTKTLAVGEEPVAVAYSRIARAAWVADALGGIAVVDGERLEVAADLETKPGISQVRFTEDGRWGFVPNPETDDLYILDAATRRIVQDGQMESGPDDVGFSDTLAYVRHRGSDLMLMIPLDQIGHEGEPIPVIDIPGGKHPPGQTDMPSSAPTIVQAPGAGAVLVANPLDQAIYFYKEGMAAPMGHFQNYGRQPRAVMVVDRSLRETERPGVYQTTARMQTSGTYDVALFVDSPRVVHCFPVEVTPNPELRKKLDTRRVHAALDVSSSEVKVGETVTFTVEVRDALTGEPKTGLQDVDVVAFLAPGIWQRRQWAKEVGGGLYEIDLTPPESGVYYVFVEIPSERLRSNEGPSLVLRAHAKTQTADVNAP